MVDQPNYINDPSPDDEYFDHDDLFDDDNIDESIEKSTKEELQMMAGTFFFYFKYYCGDNYMIPYSSRRGIILSSKSSVNQLIEKLGRSGQVCTTHNQQGIETGYVWIVHLKAKHGSEKHELYKLKKDAKTIELYTGLYPEGPLCNVEWHQTDD